MLLQTEVKQLLSLLKIDKDLDNITVKDINVAYRKLAKTIHPDKAGDEKTEAFQDLLQASVKLRDYFKDKVQSADETDEEELFFKDNFERFNYPFENKGSFTVGIEDHLADTWQSCIEELLGPPKVTKNSWGTECDRYWKVPYSDSEITLHIYNNPKNKKGSKLMLQGRPQTITCSYVFEELPKIYKLVQQKGPKSIVNKSWNNSKIETN